MNHLLAVLLLLVSTCAWAVDGVREFRIDGAIDEDALKAVREEIKAVRSDPSIKTLSIGITSQGGLALAGFGIARMLRQLSNGGVRVEIHASAICASACTWILAAGTPGSRFIDRFTFFLVHPVQKREMGEQHCVSKDATATADQDTRAMNLLLDMGRDLYMLFTGMSKSTAEDLLTCGHERIGTGELAVQLKMADKVED